MKFHTAPAPTEKTIKADAERLADLVLFAQRSCVLNLSPTLGTENVSFPQFFLLACLASEEYLTMTEVAGRFGHSTAAATGQIDHLERLAHVERVHLSADRRKVMVRITAQGRDFVTRMRKAIAADFARMLSDMDASPEEPVAGVKRTALARMVA